MANHVRFGVTFHKINGVAKGKLNEIYKRIRKPNGGDAKTWFSDMFVEGSNTYEITEKYDWTIEHIGPLWSYLEEWDEEGFYGYSAWSAPEAGLTKLLTILSEFDPKMVTSLSYEDEGPNFAGMSIFEGDEMVDGSEYDWDEIREQVINDSDRLNDDSYDEDTETWVDDEAEDIFQEEMWETINDWQMALINSTVELLLEEQEEEILQDE